MTKESAVYRLRSSQLVRWGILALISGIFYALLQPASAPQHYVYNLGDVVAEDVKAPADFFVEDVAATDEKRVQAVADVLTVYDLDTELAPRLTRQVRQSFSYCRSIIDNAGKKFVTQGWEDSISASEDTDLEKRLDKALFLAVPEFTEKIGVAIIKEAYPALVKDRFSKDAEDLIIKIISQILENGVVANKEILLQESDRGIVFREINTKTETIVTNLKRIYGMDQAKTMVRVIGQPILKNQSYVLKNLIVDISQGLLQPNITLNKSATEDRKKTAAADIKPILYKIKAGEMLLREGERVTKVQLLKVKALESQTRTEPVKFENAGAVTIVACFLFTLYFLFLRHPRHVSHDNNKDMLFIAIILIAFLLLLKFAAAYTAITVEEASPASQKLTLYFGTPLSAGAMIIYLFMGLNVAIAFALVISVCAAMICVQGFGLFIYFFLSGAMAAYWLRDCRERKVFIKAGLKLGLFNCILATAVNMFSIELSVAVLLRDWAMAFVGGISAGILTAGLTPIVELAFDYTTDIKLLELANLDRPVLRKLMMEAPGTYHHSVVIGSLVEAAATEIGANPLLAKVCGYYHDIGKVKQPLYFIENQARGKNKHDKLAPSMSSLILIAHIKNGVEIARKHKLGQPIIDTIRQHHGTSLIRFFYEKAKKLKGEENVNIENFKYHGPRPQTREAALVMLADVVEAASRTLDNPTPARIQGLVQNLINKIFSDGQLDECDLTLKDLHLIAKSFNQILTGIHHHRIEYPDSPTQGTGKGKNGNSDRQQAKPVQDRPERDSEENKGHLKRLGLS